MNLIAERIFLDRSWDKHKEFNPFIGYCTDVVLFFLEEADSEVTHKVCEDLPLLRKVKEKYGVAFDKHPEMLGTFAFYDPSRLEHSTRLTEDRCGVEFQLHDYFSLYDGAVVELTLESDEKSWSKSFAFTCEKKVFHVGFDPDKTTLKITKDGEYVYYMENSFVKRINFSMKCDLGSRIEIGGEVVKRFEFSSFEAGK